MSNRQKFTLKLDDQVVEGRRQFLLDGRPQHGVSQDLLDEALKEARVGVWRHDPEAGRNLGRKLFQLMDGTGGTLSRELQKCDRHKPCEFYITLPTELEALPVELLADESGFLQVERTLNVYRAEMDRSSSWDPVDRPLKMLFMAASPIDLEERTLNFEDEEESIQKAVEKWPVELTIDDLGSLAGLETAVNESQGFDVIHLSGHAVVDRKLGPIFCLEDENGSLDKVTPDRLAGAIKAYQPRLLFLSGCETGKGDKRLSLESYAQQMVKQGAPVVLGWGLSVGDSSATQLAQPFYEYLALGKAVSEALGYSRKSLKQQYVPWPLLRVHTDGSPIDKGLVTRREGRQPGSARRATYRQLKDEKVTVLEKGFVGRRRALQTGIRALKNPDADGGFFIHGPAGVGKSCLAGKLIDHVQSSDKTWALLVFKGKLNPDLVLDECERLFRGDREKWGKGLEILADQKDKEFSVLIDELFSTVFKEHQALWYFDDFEDNLAPFGQEWGIGQGQLEVVRALLDSLTYANYCTKFLLTSRYPFVLEIRGKNLVESLIHYPLASMKGADLEKKIRQLEGIRKAEHGDLYRAYSGGNPRVLDWLDEVARIHDAIDVEELTEKLQSKRDEYIQTYLSFLLAEHEGSEFTQFLCEAAVFQQTVPPAAFTALALSTHFIRTGVNLTLMEEERNPLDGSSYYTVHPLIRADYWDKVAAERRKQLHDLASQWYDHWLEEHDEDWISRRHAMDHALRSGRLLSAVEHARRLGNRLKAMALFREATLFFEQAMRGLPEDWAAQASRQQEGQRFTAFVNDYAQLLQATNRLAEAEPLMRQALAIDEQSYGPDHPDVAIRLNNLAQLLQATNRLAEAEPPMQRVIEILLDFQQKTRHPHPHLNTVIQNYLQLLQALKYSPEQVDKKMEELGLVKKGDAS
jgi:tetratricopeptide (TPR) repeat protein